jgi:hypothetical protein
LSDFVFCFSFFVCKKSRVNRCSCVWPSQANRPNRSVTWRPFNQIYVVAIEGIDWPIDRKHTNRAMVRFLFDLWAELSWAEPYVHVVHDLRDRFKNSWNQFKKPMKSIQAGCILTFVALQRKVCSRKACEKCKYDGKHQ